MDTYVKLCLSTLIMAFSLIISSVFASPSVNNDIVVAIQEMERANYFTFVMLINMVPPSLFQGNITFLMPSDRSLSRTKIPQNSVVDLLLNHSIPSPLLFDHLIHLPTNSTLPTSNPDLMLKVSNSGRRGLFLGNVRIISPNICTHGYSVRCHGIDDVLSIDIKKPEITCPRVGSPIPATAPLLAPVSQAPTSTPPHADAYETSGGRRPHIELALTCIAFIWVLFIVKPCV
ncbi:FAS1 domain-containing protein SELMODRAFT_448915 [Lactuca sativa]|uniref:FAS1 domain-containing protein SELMODRAFT_448915 n=1 Tax=Lactuca sativa TaxID=4236 RepID=UPI000CD83478|nr:FAS1 domain-containing protein SELMODRAFT_448915 [Lactuca sativa]